MRRSYVIPFVLALTLADSSTFAATVMRIAYGIELSEANDKYFMMVQRLAEIGEDIAVPGRYPVEAIPLLRFLPAWFPGAYFKRYAARAKRDLLSIRDQLFESAKTAMASFSVYNPHAALAHASVGAGNDHRLPHDTFVEWRK